MTYHRKQPSGYFPYGPLASFLALDANLPLHTAPKGVWCVDCHEGACLTDTRIGELIGASPSMVLYWRLHGRLIREDMADNIACRLGTHPSLIWTDWEAATAAAAADDLERDAARRDRLNTAARRRRAEQKVAA